MIALLEPYRDLVLTIAADNSKEFAYHEKVSDKLGCVVYFSDPYCSWQRGLNENTNGLLRQCWPKSTDFKKVSQGKVSRAIDELNGRPRKTLNFKTPAEMMAEHRATMITWELCTVPGWICATSRLNFAHFCSWFQINSHGTFLLWWKPGSRVKFR